MKKNKFLKVFSSAMALSVILAGCSTSSNSGSKNAPKAKVEFKTSFDNGGSAVDGATLKYGILSAQPLTGLWNPVFSDKAEDQYVNQAVISCRWCYIKIWYLISSTINRSLEPSIL